MTSADKNKPEVLVLMSGQGSQFETLLRDSVGCGIEASQDGAQAWEWIRTNRPRLVVAEILMRSMDGLRLCREIKANPATKDARVIIFSILAAEDYALEAGADAFIRKPLDGDQLINCMRDLLVPQMEALGSLRHDQQDLGESIAA